MEGLGLVVIYRRWSIDRKLLTVLIFGLLTTFSARAHAQTGWVRPVEADATSLKGQIPTINQPQPGWAQVLDIQSSDGTVAVPSCGDPTVIATVKDGIIDGMNDQYDSQGGSAAFVTKAQLGDVWVHPSFSGGSVCDMSVGLDVPFTQADDWKFQPFASDGIVKVFFFDTNN